MIEFIKIEFPLGIFLDYVKITNENGSYATMTQEFYDEMIAQQEAAQPLL
jgi:hypothetical protein